MSPAQTGPFRGRHPGARHRDLPVRPAPLRRPSVYDTTSILAFIEKRFGLQPLTSRDAHASPLLGAFNFNTAG